MSESSPTSCSQPQRSQNGWTETQNNPEIAEIFIIYHHWNHNFITRNSSRTSSSYITGTASSRDFSYHWVIYYLKAQCIHLEYHLKCEENHEEHVGDLLEVLQPLWLVIVLGGKDTGVEEHQDDDKPEHGLGLDSSTAVTTRFSVPSEMNRLLFKADLFHIIVRLLFAF